MKEAADSVDYKTFFEDKPYNVYREVLAEGNRLFQEALPLTEDNILDVMVRDTFFLDTLKDCRPERPKQTPAAPEAPPLKEEEGGLKPGVIEDLQMDVELENEENDAEPQND